MAKAKPIKDLVQWKEWWVVHQHHEVSVVRSKERPETKVERGERVKVLYGPFLSEELARDRAEKIRSKTTKARVGKGE